MSSRYERAVEAETGVGRLPLRTSGLSIGAASVTAAKSKTRLVFGAIVLERLGVLRLP